MANAVTRNAVGFCSTWWSPTRGAARKWLQTSLCVLPHSSSSCPCCSGTWGCPWPGAELGTEAHYNKGLGMAGDTLLGAKCLSSAGAAGASIKCTVPASVLTLYFSGGGLWGAVPQRGFVTSELGACTASLWCCPSRACPFSWPPAGMWGTALALKKKELRKWNVREAVFAAWGEQSSSEVLVHLTGAVWRVGAAPPAAHVAGLWGWSVSETAISPTETLNCGFILWN